MKKALYFLIIALLVMHCDGQEEYCGGQTASKQKDCKKYKLDEDEYRCCFVDSKSKMNEINLEYKVCTPLSKDEYDKIDEFVKDAKKEYNEGGTKVEVEKYSIDCGAQYIIISLLSLILLFL